MTKSLDFSLIKAQRRNWLRFWTGDESRIVWDNFPTGSWSLLDQDILQRIQHTIGAKKSMLTVAFSPSEFPIIDAMPQDIAFPVEYFIVHALRPLPQRRMSLGHDAA
jgi:hypothetical protein